MENKIIQACLDIAFELARKEGCLFVIETAETGEDYYSAAQPEIFKAGGKRLSILEEKDRQAIKKLAELDGAVIIDNSGFMKHFGATLKRSEGFTGHGKRHAFALGTSRIKDIVCILASEEDRHVRTFRDGVCVADLTGEKIPPTAEQKIVEMLNNPVSKTLIASGIAASVLTLNPIPAIITITGSHIIVSHDFEKLKEFFKG